MNDKNVIVIFPLAILIVSIHLQLSEAFFENALKAGGLWNRLLLWNVLVT